MLEIKSSPQWAQKALQKRLKEHNHGFASSEKLGIEAEYHALYQMTRYRLKAKLNKYN